jgi:hypothetical protein
VQLWAEALAGPLAEAWKDQSNLAEKTTACAAAEVIAGLVASEAAFCCAPGQPSAWEGWLKQLLRGSLANCPLELAEMWGLVVRYGVGGLINSEDDTRLAALLEIVAEPSEPVSNALSAPHPSLTSLVNLHRRRITSSSLSTVC